MSKALAVLGSIPVLPTVLLGVFFYTKNRLYLWLSLLLFALWIAMRLPKSGTVKGDVSFDTVTLTRGNESAVWHSSENE